MPERTNGTASKAVEVLRASVGSNPTPSAARPTWADKVVYSSTLSAPHTAKTRLERHFSPSAVRDLKAAAERDVLIGGPNVAAQALVAGLVDELALFVWPVVLGGRTPALATDTRSDLTLIDEHRFRAASFISATASENGWWRSARRV